MARLTLSDGMTIGEVMEYDAETSLGSAKLLTLAAGIVAKAVIEIRTGASREDALKSLLMGLDFAVISLIEVLETRPDYAVALMLNRVMGPKPADAGPSRVRPATFQNPR